MMARIYIHMLGRLEVIIDDDETIEFKSQKSRELFCYLFLHRDRPHPREVLAGRFWGENTSTQSKRYLRQALWQLQSTINHGLVDSEHRILLVDPDWIQVNPTAEYWMDIQVIEDAFSSVKGIPGKELEHHQFASLQAAELTYRGDFLDGWYADWCLMERERLELIYLAILDKVLGYCEAHQMFDLGLDYGLKILSFDPTRERSHRRLMRLYYGAGDRASALRQYERCVRALRERLDILPSWRTRVLYEEIRNGIWSQKLRESYPDLSLRETHVPLSEAVDLFYPLLDFLGKTHRTLKQELQRIEQTIRSQG